MNLEELFLGLPELLAEIQPELAADKKDGFVEITGRYSLRDEEGEYDAFDVQIRLFDGYPDVEPKMYEVGERIPREPERHVNPDNSCCFGVWERWCLLADDNSVRAFLQGPVRSYFVSQVVCELKGVWPFGEFSHGGDGLVEAGAELLSCPNNSGSVIAMIDAVLAGDFPPEDQCPCGSKVRAADCHLDQIERLHQKYSSRVLQSFKQRIESQSVGSAAQDLLALIRNATKAMGG